MAVTTYYEKDADLAYLKVKQSRLSVMVPKVMHKHKTCVTAD